MTSFDHLQSLLESQYGPFIRDSKYKKAFDETMHILQSLDAPASNQDHFYLFLHLLMIKLFEEIEQLNTELQKVRNNSKH